MPVVLTLIALSGFALSYTSVARLQSQQAAVVRMRSDLNDLNEFTRAYLQHYDEGSRRQFEMKSEQILQNLAEFSARGEHVASAEEIRNDVEQMRTYFADISANHERGGSVAQEAESRLSSLLFIRSTQADETAAALVTGINRDIVERHRAISASVAAATVLAAVVLGALLLALRSGIIHGLDELAAGTERVGRGELGHRIGLSRNDELGDLGRSFDVMSERLQELTVSRTELEQSLGATTLLLDSARSLSASLNLDDTLRSLAAAVTKATGRQRISVDLYDAERRLVSVTALNPGPSIPAGATYAIDQLAPQVGQAILDRRPHVIDFEDPRLPPSVRERARGAGHILVAVIPLVRAGHVLGFFRIDDPGERREFSVSELELAEGIAAHAAAAIDNARIYESERRIAAQLQEALLALPDRIEGIEFAHAYHSATEMARVGGDFYDIFELDRDHIGITIGDVAGKGMNAAVLTSLAKNTIRAHANEQGKTPASILGLTNAVLYRSTSAESFVTLFFGILDRRDGCFVYASGGHTTALMIAADGAVQTLPFTGPLLGAFLEATFEESDALLNADAVLLLYTDGLIEARSPEGESYGEGRLTGHLRSARHGSASEVVETVIEDVLTFSAGQLNDDLGILAIRRMGDASAAPDQHELEFSLGARRAE